MCYGIYMLKILIIEVILSCVLGAVVFRLSWALTKSQLASWTVVFIISAIILFFFSGTINEDFIAEYAGEPSIADNLSPLIVNLLRCTGLLIGAWLASLAITSRKKIGLEDEPTYKDFP